MSKIYNIYLDLKKQNSKTIYLFKSGIFFIALDEDAYTLSNLFNFKINNFTPSVVKCGFPCNSLEKYMKIFKAHSLQVKIIEPNQNISYKLKEYNQSEAIIDLLNLIKSIDINTLSISEAYKFLEKLQNSVLEII